MSEREEVFRPVVALGGEATEVLELVEAVFDPVAQPVCDFVMRDGDFARAGQAPLRAPGSVRPSQ